MAKTEVRIKYVTNNDWKRSVGENGIIHVENRTLSPCN